MSEVLSLAAEHVQRHEPCALCTVIRSSGSVPRHAGAKMLVGMDGGILAGTVGGGEMEKRVIELARQVIREGAPRTASYQLSDPASGDPGVCGGQVEIFVEPLLTSPTLLIAGAGHVGRALAHLAKWAGFRVIVTDDRPELCTPAACPGADEYLPGPLIEQLAQIPLTLQTYVALVTRGSPFDVEALPLLLRSDVAYIGAIGSRRRWLTTADALRARGIPESDLARVHAPIGLELHAETPEEIAISIMAEIVKAHRTQNTEHR